MWLINEIQRAETKLKYLNALLIMLSHVERADDYSDSDDDSDSNDDSDGDTLRTADIQLLDEDSDEE